MEPIALVGIGVYLALALAAAIAGLFGLLYPLPRRTVTHGVFVKAPSQVVWDAYLMHVKRAQYRPGMEILGTEILSEHPLTVRAIVRMDYMPEPTRFTYAFPIYEPPYRFRLEPITLDGAPARDFIEETTLTEADGGTRLEALIHGPRSPFLPRWLAARRVRRNMQALAAYCEGRKVSGPRAPMRQPRWGWLVPFIVVLSLLLSDYLPYWLLIGIWVLILPWYAWRGWDYARRF